MSSGWLQKEDSSRISRYIEAMQMEIMGVELIIPIYNEDPAITKALAKMKENKKKRDLERAIEKEQKQAKKKRLRENKFKKKVI